MERKNIQKLWGMFCPYCNKFGHIFCRTITLELSIELFVVKKLVKTLNNFAITSLLRKENKKWIFEEKLERINKMHLISLMCLSSNRTISSTTYRHLQSWVLDFSQEGEWAREKLTRPVTAIEFRHLSSSKKSYQHVRFFC